MKQIILLCVLAFGTTAAFAQTSDHSSYAPIKYKKPAKTVTHDARFEATEMSFSDGILSFSNIPTLAKDPWAVVTDENGEMIKQGRITNNSALDVHKLSKGLYFVSIVYRDRTEKGFVLTIE